METLDFRPTLLAWLEMQSEEMDAKKCNRKGVGGMIRRMRRRTDGETAAIFGNSTRETLRLLEGHCIRCGRCKERP